MFERLSRYNSTGTRTSTRFRACSSTIPESMREHKDRLHDILLVNKVLPVIAYTVPYVISLITVIALDRAQRSSAPSLSLVANAATCNTRQHGLPKCHCYGKTGHMSSACPTTYPACNQKNCPGNYSGCQACVITPVNPPTMFKNANNHNVSDGIYQHFLRVHASRHGGASAAAAPNHHYRQTANNGGLQYIANSAFQAFDTWNPSIN